MKNIQNNLNMSQRAINEFKTVRKEELNAKWAAFKNRGKKRNDQENEFLNRIFLMR